jgi:ATP-binding cassette subfamily F protein uup
LLDRVSTVVLGLEEGAKPERFADYSQWAAELAARKKAKPKAVASSPGSSTGSSSQKKKLSYIESREFEAMEQKIADLEEALHEKRASLEAAALEVSHKEPRRLETLYKEIETAQDEIDSLYVRWGELGEKAGA